MIPKDIEMIFLEVKDNVGMLMIDEVGSKVIQKFFAVCEDEQMNKVVSLITVDAGLLMAICLDSWGSQSVLKLLDCITTRIQLNYLISALEKIFVFLTNHPIGSTIIRHYCIVFPAEVEPILALVAQHLLKIVYTESGSRLVQAVMSNVFNLSGQRCIYGGIMLNLLYLSTHRFGSHVVLHLIGFGLENMLESMIYVMRGSFVYLSTNKYGSIVVKKFIEASKGTGRHTIIDEIFSSPDFSRVIQNPCLLCCPISQRILYGDCSWPDYVSSDSSNTLIT
ncbi:pumilio homolog 11-like [Henckelia pumila]|uniref:pumilio homolog 11-like n=1 Tax=Henckelia pumila TaxID=405737 RepID=UPI003C6E19F6